tara:strand:- start:1605 stop:1832 length:228 start_codon:yes stop_codon:yes gene_type:complete
MALLIKVEVQAGTSVRQAVEEARTLARHMNISWVSYNFNGTRMSIGRNANIADTVADWEEQQRHPDAKHRTVVSN